MTARRKRTSDRLDTVGNRRETGNVPVVHGKCEMCGRPVTGFPGDFAKCKSCRHMHMLSGDPPAGWRTVADPARLTALPFYFVLLFYATLVAIYWTGGGKNAQGGTDLAGSAVVVIVFAMWIFSVMQFSKTAERQRGWWLPVLEYHVTSLLLVPCFAWALGSCNSMFQGDVSANVILSLLVVVVVLFICVLIYGDARRRVAHLKIVRDR